MNTFTKAAENKTAMVGIVETWLCETGRNLRDVESPFLVCNQESFSMTKGGNPTIIRAAGT